MTGTPDSATTEQSLPSFLTELRQQDVKLWVDGGRLRVSAPNGTLTAELQKRIAAHKAGIVNLLQQVTASSPLPVPLVRSDVGGPARLSFSQQRLWFLDQLQPGSAAYHIPVLLRLRGHLEAAALRLSLDEIVRRHEALRTRFVVVDGEARQVVDAAEPLDLQSVDLRLIHASGRVSEALRLARQEWSRPFDLKQSPMLRARLYELSDDDSILVCVVHHIAADGWSLGVLMRELTALYGAFVLGRASPLASLPIQYSDYASWQRDWLKGERFQTQLSYWTAKLAGRLPMLDLPFDRPYPAALSGKGARHTFTLDRALVGALKEFSRREDVTPFMTLLAAFKVLLNRATRQEDILVGTPVANRGQVEIEGLMGIFINNLVMRTDLSGTPTFREVLGRVRATAIEAYANQDVPFEKLVEVLQPDRESGRQPLFQVLFAVQNLDLAEPKLSGLQVELIRLYLDTARFDLGFEFYERPAGMEVWVEYSTDLFDQDTIRRLCEHFQIVLNASLAAPEARIAELPVISASERQLLVSEWNQTHLEFPAHLGIHQLIEDQAARSPAAPAVLFENETISYADLNGRANRLARYLIQLGVGPDSIVGLHFERSIDMVVAVLGILKARGAYLPLDPLFPPDRLRHMLADSGAGVLITHSRLRNALPTQEEAQVVCLDRDATAIAAFAPHDLAESAAGEDLAYVLYTSGSTGRPKGVQVSHANVVSFLTSMRQQPGMAAADVLLSVTTLAFDICGLELFLPLSTGASVVLVSSAVAANGAQLLARLNAIAPTIMQATPATWRLLLAAGWEGTPELRVLCGGEALSGELANQLMQRSGALWNMYGPTETTIWSTVHRVVAGDGPNVPIGRPIGNTQVYVLDTLMQPVAIGVAGELYIGGHGLARGYLNQPELTAQRFVPNPFDKADTTRLYRTGDLVRYRADGTLEYLDRLDTQVKLRGYRIELGEIEMLLEQYPSMGQAVVAVREDIPGDKRLVAYITLADAHAPSVSDMREYLKDRLPPYMLPSAFVTLERLPLTPNGKVDRKALPAPAAELKSSRAQLVPPGSALERTIAEAWQEVLHLQEVGITDNFFDLGGHSLLVLQVHARLRQNIDTDLTLAQMFQYPTVEALAQHIERHTPQTSRMTKAHDRGQQSRIAAARQAQTIEQGRAVL